jgi:membrane-bound lytic murein transglycosylase F
VTDRLDARQSVIAGARYLQEIRRALSPAIMEPDRTWLALAAYNIGIAHLEDARLLAQKRKLDPDSWPDLKKTLPLLAKPEYASKLRYGYARGGAPVVFVENIRAYYDILLRMEQPYAPRLRVTGENARRVPGVTATTADASPVR